MLVRISSRFQFIFPETRGYQKLMLILRLIFEPPTNFFKLFLALIPLRILNTESAHSSKPSFSPSVEALAEVAIPVTKHCHLVICILQIVNNYFKFSFKFSVKGFESNLILEGEDSKSNYAPSSSFLDGESLSHMYSHVNLFVSPK